MIRQSTVTSGGDQNEVSTGLWNFQGNELKPLIVPPGQLYERRLDTSVIVRQDAMLILLLSGGVKTLQYWPSEFVLRSHINISCQFQACFEQCHSNMLFQVYDLLSHKCLFAYKRERDGERETDRDTERNIPVLPTSFCVICSSNHLKNYSRCVIIKTMSYNKHMLFSIPCQR